MISVLNGNRFKFDGIYFRAVTLISFNGTLVIWCLMATCVSWSTTIKAVPYRRNSVIEYYLFVEENSEHEGKFAGLLAAVTLSLSMELHISLLNS